MKKILYTCLMFLAVLDSRAQFNTTPRNWPTPSGGAFSGSTQLGFNTNSGTANAAGAQSWFLADVDGDKRPDLVVTAAYTSGAATQFNASTAPAWQVHLNTGGSFSNTITTWSTPTGGIPTLGLNAKSNVSATTDAAGTQSWDIVDINGDGKPDLVVTGAVGLQFGAGTNNTNWQVYLNTGTGFSNTATTWNTPTGGTILGGNPEGFAFTSGTAVTGQDNFSASWSLIDMDGDGKPDLVVTANLTAAGATEDEIGHQEQWNVYLNTGTGFSLTPTAWYTPSGGAIVAGDTLGFNALNGVAAAGQSNGSSSWSLLDVNGDGKPDLVVTGVLGSSGVTEVGTNTWQVYLNTGTAFASTATAWSTPSGQGFVPAAGGNAIGFNGISNVAVYPAQGVNSQSWVVTDLDGDGKPDLVVTASLGTSGPSEYSPGVDSYWEFFKGNGTSGFSNSSTQWRIPNGGKTTTAGGYLGYNYTFDVASTTEGDAANSYTWVTMDLEGNGFPDLVYQGNLATAGNTEQGTASSPYWQIYRNAGAPADTSTVGIISTPATFACQLYPNPNNGNFKLVFADNVVREVEVTDVTGQTLISNLHVAQQAEINMPSFAQGIYFVTIRQEGASKVMLVSVAK